MANALETVACASSKRCHGAGRKLYVSSLNRNPTNNACSKQVLKEVHGADADRLQEFVLCVFVTFALKTLSLRASGLVGSFAIDDNIIQLDSVAGCRTISAVWLSLYNPLVLCLADYGRFIPC